MTVYEEVSNALKEHYPEIHKLVIESAEALFLQNKLSSTVAGLVECNMMVVAFEAAKQAELKAVRSGKVVLFKGKV